MANTGLHGGNNVVQDHRFWEGFEERNFGGLGLGTVSKQLTGKCMNREVKFTFSTSGKF